jgi:hypothetical protein
MKNQYPILCEGYIDARWLGDDENPIFIFLTNEHKVFEHYTSSLPSVDGAVEQLLIDLDVDGLEEVDSHYEPSDEIYQRIRKTLRYARQKFNSKQNTEQYYFRFEIQTRDKLNTYSGDISAHYIVKSSIQAGHPTIQADIEGYTE